MDKIDFMNGQIKALMNFATAVIRSHPSPDILRHQFETIARAEPSSPEGLSLSEAYVDGVADIDRQIAIVLEHAIAKDSEGPSPD
jgi:tRNA U38,U39,U40 pseudouridine synthase TruA